MKYRYQPRDLVEIISTGERGSVLSCSTSEVIVLGLSGRTYTLLLDEVRRA